jgi:hypothetical protein
MSSRYTYRVVGTSRVWSWCVIGSFGLTVCHGIAPSRAAAVLAAEKAIWKLKRGRLRNAAPGAKAQERFSCAPRPSPVPSWSVTNPAGRRRRLGTTGARLPSLAPLWVIGTMLA